jgi:nicotinate-nucleotide pyrophosphorylase (carboxylating)
VNSALEQAGLRREVVLAFAGGVRLEDLPEVLRLGGETVDMGRAILDAPVLDLRLRVSV